MPKKAEIMYCIQNDRPSITIHLSEEGDLTPDLRGMLSQIQEAITDFQKSPQARLLPSTEVAVQDVPKTLPSAQPKVFTDSSKSDPTKMISPKQMSLLTRKLRENGTTVEALCQANGVNRIQDLTMARAREIIHDLTDY